MRKNFARILVSFCMFAAVFVFAPKNTWAVQIVNGIYLTDEGGLYSGIYETEDGRLLYILGGSYDETRNGIYDNYLVINGEVATDYIGVYGKWNVYYYVVNGVVDTTYTGLVETEENIYIFENGLADRNLRKIIEIDGVKYYSHLGKYEQDVNEIIKLTDGNTVCIKNGILDETVTGIRSGCYFDEINNTHKTGELYFDKGVWQKEITDFVSIKGIIHRIEKGVWNQSFDGVQTYNGKNCVFQQGRLNSTFTGIAKKGDSYVYFEGGKLNSSFKGLALYEGEWKYVNKGVANFKYTGIVAHDGKYMYMKNGALQIDYTGLVKSGNTNYYFVNGTRTDSYSGYATVNKKVYKITKGKATIAKKSVPKKINLKSTDSYYKIEKAYRTNSTKGLSAKDKKLLNGIKPCLDYAYLFAEDEWRVKAVHDYIVLNCTYDYDNYLNHTIPSISYTLEGVFTKKIAVCDGYAKAFKLCMEMLGLKCDRITGIANGGGHAWNGVYIKGDYYLVDCTWDDPVGVKDPKYIRWDYFNITTTQMSKDHKTSFKTKATATKYNYSYFEPKGSSYSNAEEAIMEAIRYKRPYIIIDGTKDYSQFIVTYLGNNKLGYVNYIQNGLTYYKYGFYYYGGAPQTVYSTNINSISNTAKGLTLKWTKVDSASGYIIYRKAAGESKYTKLATINKANTVSYTDTKVTNGVKYAYYIKSFDAFNTSCNSATKTVIRVSETKVKTLKNSSAKKATITWDKNAKATGYEIQYSLKKDFSSGVTKVNVSNAKTVSKTIDKLTKGKTYYVRIRCYTKSGSTTFYSVWSDVKSIKITK